MFKLPFQEQFRDSILDGTKTMTCRTKAYGAYGDTFEAFGETFEILLIQRVPLCTMDTLWQFEGVDSFQEFQDVWKKLHPRKPWDDYQRVYVHGFVAVDATPFKKLTAWWNMKRYVEDMFPKPKTMPAGVGVETRFLNELVDLQPTGMDALPDGLVMALYRYYSDIRWAAGWMNGEGGKGFSDWILATAVEKPEEDYEAETIEEFRDYRNKLNQGV